MAYDAAIRPIDPTIQAIERANRRVDRDVHTEMAQAAKTSCDVKCDVIVSWSAREPWPGTVAKLHFREFLKVYCDFIIQPILLEEHADVLARLAFGRGLPQPRGLLQHHAL